MQACEKAFVCRQIRLSRKPLFSRKHAAQVLMYLVCIRMDYSDHYARIHHIAASIITLKSTKASAAGLSIQTLARIRQCNKQHKMPKKWQVVYRYKYRGITQMRTSRRITIKKVGDVYRYLVHNPSFGLAPINKHVHASSRLYRAKNDTRWFT